MSKRSSILLLLLTLSLSLPLSLLRADDFFAIKDKVISDSVFKIGFFYFTPLLLVDNIGYTSNIFSYQEDDNPDWTGDLGMGLRASSIIANRLIIQAEDLPVYSYYLNNKNLRSWSNRFGASAYSYLGPLNLKARFVLNDLTQRPYDEFSRPFRFSDREWSGEVDIGRRSNLFLTVYAKFNELAYEENPYLGSYYLAESLNRHVSNYGVNLNKRVFTNTVIYLRYEMSDYIFTENSKRDSNARSLGLGIEFPEIGVLQGNLHIGFSQLEPKNPLFKKSRNLSGRGMVYLTLFERLRLNMFYTMGTNFSFSADELFYSNQSLGGGFDIYLTRFLKGGATYQEGHLEYKSFLDLELQRSDRITQQQYFLAVPFFGKTSIGLAYHVYRLRSDALNLDYIRSFWGGFISYGF